MEHISVFWILVVCGNVALNISIIILIVYFSKKAQVVQLNVHDNESDQ